MGSRRTCWAWPCGRTGCQRGPFSFEGSIGVAQRMGLVQRQDAIFLAVMLAGEPQHEAKHVILPHLRMPAGKIHVGFHEAVPTAETGHAMASRMRANTGSHSSGRSCR